MIKVVIINIIILSGTNMLSSTNSIIFLVFIYLTKLISINQVTLIKTGKGGGINLNIFIM